MRTYGVSVLSLMAAQGFGRCLLSGRGLQIAREFARELGVKIQMLPLEEMFFRTTREITGWSPDEVISIEDRWGSPIPHACLELFKRHRLVPALAAYVLFMGTRRNTRTLQELRKKFPNAIWVDTGSGSLIDPDINLNPNWSFWASQGFGSFVLDTHHMREFGLSAPVIMEWVEEMAGAKRIGLVHLQFRSEMELDQYVKGQGLTAQMICAVKHTDVPVVIELDNKLSTEANIKYLLGSTKILIG